MTIELQKLEYDNMFSYGLNNIIQFNENPVTQLTAPNGSGKSSIALIIQEILYSKNVKGIKKTDIANRYSNTNSWLGELSFKVNNNEYIVKVTRKGATSKVYLEENGKDISEHKIPDTYKKIRDILGMDFEIFSQLTYQSSVDLLDFLKATDTNRKKFLINLFNLQKYIEIGEIVKTTLNLAEKELAVLDGKLQGIEDFIQNTVIGEIQTLKDVPEVDNLLVEKQRELLEEVKNYEVLCKKIDKNMSYREDLNRLDFDVNRNAPDELTMEINKNTMDSYSKTLIEYTVQQQDIIIQSGKLDLSDTCYACGHLLDNTQAKELEDKLKDKLETIRVEMSNIQTLYDTRQLDQAVLMHKKREYIINQQNIEKFEQLSQLIDKSLPPNYPDYKEITTSLQNVSDTLNEQQTSRETILQQNEQIKNNNVRVETLRDQKRQFLAGKELLNNDIIVFKDRIKKLDILKKAFSTTGIVAFKLENLTKELEDAINNYLTELSDGQFQVVFRLTGEKLNIVVINNGKETPIETVSGGEFSRIQTAILLAIRNVLTKLGGNSVNLLFLDEITGVLDKAGKEKLLDILSEEYDLNVFLISHDFEHPMINKISITKENNISRIE